MINNDYNNRKIGINKKLENEKQTPALTKLTEFISSMEKSDFKNSYTRLSIEMKLIDDAIIEMQTNKNFNEVDNLKQRKSEVIEKLAKMGFKIKNNYPK